MGLPGETDIGRSASSTILKVAAVAVAALQTANAIKIAGYQEDIAKRYLAIAQKMRDYYNSTYTTYENDEVAEACSAVPYTKMDKTTIAKMRASAIGALAQKWDSAIVCSPRYCTGLAEASLVDLAEEEARAIAKATITGNRYEDAKWLLKEDIRHSRLNTALNRGRDMLSQSLTYSDVSAQIYGKMGRDVGRAAAGAMGYLGYTSRRGGFETETRQVMYEPYEPYRGPDPIPIEPPRTPQVQRRILG